MASCDVCGVDNPDRAKFCLECGAQLAATAPERFRRTVTILFSDIVGSTALGEQLDPETLSRVMSEYFAAVKPAVEHHGGTLAKFIGDAVMAVFGLTKLHEDDALRAVKAAVEMRASLAQLNAELERLYGVVLSARTGINTGPVAGEGLTPDRNFVAGDTANTAARLQTAAGPGEIARRADVPARACRCRGGADATAGAEGEAGGGHRLPPARRPRGRGGRATPSRRAARRP